MVMPHMDVSLKKITINVADRFYFTESAVTV